MRKNIFAVTRLLIPVALAAAAILALAACAPVVDSGGGTSLPSAGKGTVSIRLGIDGAGPSASLARTLLPAAVTANAFDAYTLVFTEEESGTSVPFTDVTSLTADLDEGTYTLVLTAKKGGVAVAAGTVTGIVVTEGNETGVTVPLTFNATEEGTGTLTVAVTNDSGLTLTQEELSWTPLSNGTPAGNQSVSSAAKTLKAGYYLVTVILSNGERTAKRSDVAHIGAGQTTPLAWTFAASDFSTTVTDIWLLGNGDQWETYNAANKLTQENDGIFVWEGVMTSAYFRFSLESTADWTADKLRPDRFQPDVNDAPITINESVDMIFVPKNTGTGTAWHLGGTGYYRFAVDPYAKTVTVTKPVIVTGVAIKDVGQNAEITEISLEQGTANYEFAAVVSGHNMSTAVTWGISGTVANGTSISAEGKLTIAAAEPVKAGAFTVTATSTVDPEKSASVTVSVIIMGIPKLAAPTNVELSNMGVATWPASTNNAQVVNYTVSLYKDTSTQIQSEDVATAAGPSYSVDFLSKMRESGAGSYTVKVKAVGNGTSYSDSDDVTSAAQTVSAQTAPQNVWWYQPSKARWVNVDGSSNYAVQLYKGGTAVGGPVSVTRNGETNPGNLSETVTTHDFTGDITVTGSYTFRVVTKGDDKLVLDSPESTISDAYSYIATLPAPSAPTLSTGSVTWTPVTGASSHTVKLYKGGTSIATYTGKTSGFSVLDDMRSNGVGSYAVTVSAIGDGTNWLSSSESAASNSETVAALGAPVSLAWSGNSAVWDAVTNATGYSVQLYKDGSLLGAAVSSVTATHDFSGQITAAGSYTFTVRATGAGLYLDGEVSTTSPSKQVGGTADITLTASEKWSGTLDISGGTPASIPKSSGSLTITVNGSSFTTFVWIVDGAPLGGETGASITLTGTDYSLGGHSVTVYALDSAGVPWSPQSPITFLVTAN